ncbi:host-nuclease inhibitor Gam family protein [Sphingomonas profundi]|uniref:host-nuclease inhibitor Gam family protein n=1 Tax=Alterirhizorhabdus profundi TaxID=2681549 RepID=UPI0012E7612C|nr:host-nuclease inhibitor Gam family protein [Sphingomonas profundi]
MKLRITAPVEQATALLERFAALGHQIALAEAGREEAIARSNAVADGIVVPLLHEQGELREQLAAWWGRSGAALLTGKRKTLELGGCMIGSKAGRTRLEFAGGDDAAALAKLREHRWAKPYVRVSYSVDKVETKKGLEGKHAQQLYALGFSVPPAEEVFLLERVVQDGVVTR